MTPLRWFLVCVSILLCILPTWFLCAQVLPFQHYTLNDGLLTNGVAELYQDSHGYLFVSSAEGLSIFDGASFTHYRTKDGLPSNFVNCVVEQPGPQGVMWIGTNNGLAIFSSNRFKHIPVDTTQRSLLIRSIFVDLRGAVWCGSLGGLYTIRGDVVGKVDLGIDLVNEIKVAGASPDSVVWVVVGNVLLAFRLSGEVIRRIPLSNSKTNHFTDALADKYGNVWVGLRDSTLSVFQGGVLVARRRMQTGRVQHLMVDQEKELYIGTEGGLLTIDINRFSRGDFERLTTKNGLPSNSITGGLIDKERSIWLLSGGMGMTALKTRGVWTFPMSDIHAAYNNARAACDSAGHFWVLSGDSLAEILRVGKSDWLVTKHGVGATSATGKPIGVVYDKNHRLWVGFSEGWIHSYRVQSERKKAGTLSLINTLPTGVPDLFLTFIIDSRDRLWFQQGSRVVVMDHKRNTLVQTYPCADMRTMYEDRKGKIWLGHFSGGITVVNGDGRDTSFAVGPALPAGFIRALREDNDGRMWVGTRYSGCAVLDGDSVHQLSAENALPSDAVWCIARDRQGMMWLGTGLGLVAVNPVTRKTVLMGNDIVRDPVLSLGVSPRNEIWFVTPGAFGIIDGRILYEPLQAPIVLVDRMEVDEQRVALVEDPDFPYDRNNFTFSFLSISFRRTQDIRYQYRLLGLDDDWQQPTSRRSVTYASLDPGDYHFEVRATRVGTAVFSPPADVSFTITPPFWSTWWFRTFSALSIIAGLFVTYSRRVRGLEKEKRIQQEFSVRLMESQENERKRIAGELHDSLVQNLLIAKNRSIIGLQRIVDPKAAAKELTEISSVISDAIQEVREIAHNFRPYQLDRIGLTRAIQSLVEKINETFPVSITVEVENIDRFFTAENGIQLYRIVQEGVNNIIKHSGATEAAVQIKNAGTSINLAISDNGKGISTDGADGKGFGLSGLEQRARMLRGTLAINTGPSRGTSLHVSIPVDAQGTAT